MILYHPQLNINLVKYGIEIPLFEARLRLAFESLGLDVSDISSLTPLGPEDLLLAHDEDFVERFFDREKAEGEIKKAYELVDAQGKNYRFSPGAEAEPLVKLRDEMLLHGAGTGHVAQKAIEKGLAYYLGGGLHHAMSFGGRGFCPFHDVVIAIRKLQQAGKVQTAWVIDVDAHKGDGTAEITKNDESIQTLSIHMGSSWPLDPESGEGPWQIPSNVDIPIESGEEADYCARLEDGLGQLQGKPDLAFIIQGADPYELDQLPSTAKLNLSLSQLKERDQLVYEFLKQRGIPQAYVVGGGYGEHSHKVYEQFFNLLREAGHVLTV